MDLKSICTGGFSIALLTICSWITIPFTIPFTLQTFAIYLIIFLFGGKKGTIYIGCYILGGIGGLPIFSNLQGGFPVLFGATGGYLLGFLASSIFLWSTENFWSNRPQHFFWISILSLFLCYSFGTFWFLWINMQNHISFSFFQALELCVFPFVILDLLKIKLAAHIGKQLKPFI